jgi:hypothetical protein
MPRLIDAPNIARPEDARVAGHLLLDDAHGHVQTFSPPDRPDALVRKDDASATRDEIG